MEILPWSDSITTRIGLVEDRGEGVFVFSTGFVLMTFHHFAADTSKYVGLASQTNLSPNARVMTSD